MNALSKLNFAYKYLKMKSDSAAEIRDKIVELNADSEVHGIIVQSPIHDHMCGSFGELVDSIAPEKDVDGLGAHSKFIPCTALAIKEITDYYRMELRGRHVLVIGRSRIVGGPVAKLLARDSCTLTVAHSETPADLLQNLIESADMIVSAAGEAGLVKAVTVKQGAVLIDVGISRQRETGRICGDIDHSLGQESSHHFYYYTPVPGGVGPVTVAKLAENLFTAYTLQMENNSG